MTCVPGAAGQRRRRCSRSVARGALRRGGSGGRRGAAGWGGGGGAGLGEILTRTQINSPSDIKTHLGGLDDRKSNVLNTDE